jgi:hypothetical protein
MSPQLNGPHRNTDDAISRHPAVRNLVWRGVRSMLRSLTGVAPRPPEHLMVTRDRQPPALHAWLDTKPFIEES